MFGVSYKPYHIVSGWLDGWIDDTSDIQCRTRGYTIKTKIKSKCVIVSSAVNQCSVVRSSSSPSQSTLLNNLLKLFKLYFFFVNIAGLSFEVHAQGLETKTSANQGRVNNKRQNI